MRFFLCVPALCALSSIALLACSDATGSLVGGYPVMLAGGTTGDDGGTTTGDGGLTYISSLSAACQPGGANGGSRWQDLYACYFAPGGVASCSFTPGGCHGTTGEIGALSSGGYVCAADPTACYQSMTTTLVLPGAAPSSTILFGVLRKADGTGRNMPLMPETVVFQNGDMSRIVDWITNGAHND